MTDTVHSAIDAFFAFRSRQIQRAAWDNTMRQMTALPHHLIADVDPYACRDQLDEIPPKALETPEQTQRLRFFASVTSQTGYFHR
ncbi:hypothetical protein SB748_26090 [Rhizobium sp. SIMBA_035]